MTARLSRREKAVSGFTRSRSHAASTRSQIDEPDIPRDMSQVTRRRLLSAGGSTDEDLT